MATEFFVAPESSRPTHPRGSDETLTGQRDISSVAKAAAATGCKRHRALQLDTGEEQ